MLCEKKSKKEEKYGELNLPEACECSRLLRTSRVGPAASLPARSGPTAMLPESLRRSHRHHHDSVRAHKVCTMHYIRPKPRTSSRMKRSAFSLFVARGQFALVRQPGVELPVLHGDQSLHCTRLANKTRPAFLPLTVPVPNYTFFPFRMAISAKFAFRHQVFFLVVSMRMHFSLEMVWLFFIFGKIYG